VTAPGQNALAVAIDVEWDDDFAVERAALAPLRVEVVPKPELRESQASSVVALLTGGSHVSGEDAPLPKPTGDLGIRHRL
jgi:hypothetical protein